MEQDFLRPLIVTLIVGTLIVGAGTSILLFAFRAVADGRAGERRYLGLSIALVAFVFICCAVFFTWSLR